MIKLKRAYDPTAKDDGFRFLVERLWPRGIRKGDLKTDDWLKDVAPSAELRRWFSHDPAKWNTFRKRYLAELDSQPDAWEGLLKTARRATVTLIYSSRDTRHNSALALKDYLERRMKRAGPHRQKLAA